MRKRNLQEKQILWSSATCLFPPPPSFHSLFILWQDHHFKRRHSLIKILKPMISLFTVIFQGWVNNVVTPNRSFTTNYFLQTVVVNYFVSDHNLTAFTLKPNKYVPPLFLVLQPHHHSLTYSTLTKLLTTCYTTKAIRINDRRTTH